MPGIILFGEIAAGPIHRKGVDADPHGEGKIPANFLLRLQFVQVTIT